MITSLFLFMVSNIGRLRYIDNIVSGFKVHDTILTL